MSMQTLRPCLAAVVAIVVFGSAARVFADPLPRLMLVQVPSTADGENQPVRYWAPPEAKATATPILVSLHSWSADGSQDRSAWLIEAAARRQKWIDQSQSLNIYIAGVSGKKLDETYKLAWLRGLKTTYYLRSMGATGAEKSTVQAGSLNAVPAHGGISASSLETAVEIKYCAIDDESCESCQ